MQAIKTKHLAPTNHKGSRIKASCERGSITINWDYSLGRTIENYINACNLLCQKFDDEDSKEYGTTQKHWTREKVCGEFNGEYYHVFLSKEKGTL